MEMVHPCTIKKGENWELSLRGSTSEAVTTP